MAVAATTPNAIKEGGGGATKNKGEGGGDSKGGNKDGGGGDGGGGGDAMTTATGVGGGETKAEVTESTDATAMDTPGTVDKNAVAAEGEDVMD